MHNYVLGIDIGTESIRVSVFDERGYCSGAGVSENHTFYPHPGWAEQSVQQWETSLIEAIQEALSSSGVNPGTISGIGIDATCPTLICLDQQGKPMRNAVMWMDVRATHEASEIAGIDDPAMKVVGFGKVSPEWFPCKALWLKRNEPDLYEKAHVIFDQPDWLSYILTGEYILNLNNITVRWFYDSEAGAFPKDFYKKIGLEDFLEKVPARVVRPGERISGLSRKIAVMTGLPKGIPVAGGGADAYIGVIGVNALQVGQMALITGSSHLQIGLVKNEFHAPGIHGTYSDAVLKGFKVVEAGQISTGSVVKWFADNFLRDTSQTSGDDGPTVYAAINEQASKIPVGSEGLLVLEHWQGNRTPWVDPTSRGVIRGFTLSHTPAHIFRAIMEGVVYGTTVILQNMQKHGVEINEIIACGGATNSELWMQIHADVTGKPIRIPVECQAPSLGGAILASVASGMYQSIIEAAACMVRTEKIVEPHLDNKKEYDFYIDQYIRTYESLKVHSREMVENLDKTSGLE